MDRAESQSLARERLADAQALFSADRFSGSYYLAGYAVECGLKACVAKRTVAESFPDRELANMVYTHDLKRLARAAELDGAIEQRAHLDADFELSWAIVNAWSEEARYGSWSKPRQSGCSTRSSIRPWSFSVRILVTESKGFVEGRRLVEELEKQKFPVVAAL